MVQEELKAIAYLPRNRFGLVLPVGGETDASSLQNTINHLVKPACGWVCLRWTDPLNQSKSSLLQLAQGLKNVRGRAGG